MKRRSQEEQQGGSLSTPEVEVNEVGVAFFTYGCGLLLTEGCGLLTYRVRFCGCGSRFGRTRARIWRLEVPRVRPGAV